MLKLQRIHTPITGELTVPGDKSISHRAVMLSALADGTSEITGFLNSGDCIATVNCFRSLGIEIEERRTVHGAHVVNVHGQGLYGFKKAAGTLYTGNSGTTTRLMAGILAAQPFSSRVTGDASIENRPMMRIIDPLTKMGARIKSEHDNGCCPLLFDGVAPGDMLTGINYHNPVASAQVKSAILLSGLYAEGDTIVHEPAPSRNHTEVMLRAFGADIRHERTHAGTTTSILHPGDPLRAMKITIPGDISSAAFFIAAACLLPDSDLLLKRVGINETRSGILTVLKQMGADITVTNEKGGASEPYADIRVRYAELHGSPSGPFTIAGKLVPTLIDELPIIAVLAAFVPCITVIQNAEELRVKETDRIAAICENLTAMGCNVDDIKDGMVIYGGDKLHGANIKTYGDHRIAMAFAIAALAVDGETTIDDETCVNISYPRFFETLTRLTT
ncbi:MAG: 3-phosphoshikimate 1-carboxyvinyltransferase [Lachnospiraceae bacterium]|nr:3-phosphoshikimate 1-carboxyvinyltransferase [Lachnospiraceae bacterium]